MGRLSGRAPSTYACSWQSGAPPASRMGQRRMDVRHTLVDGNIDSGTQQQWIARNSEWGGWTGSNWNMVFVGVTHPPEGDWPRPPYTKIDQTPVVREKPFQEVDGRWNWSVCVPALRTNSAGITWHGESTPGRRFPLTSFISP